MYMYFLFQKQVLNGLLLLRLLVYKKYLKSILKIVDKCMVWKIIF